MQVASSVMQKTCKACGETKPAIKGVWVVKYGVPNGMLCLVCSRVSNRRYRSNEDGRLKYNALNSKAKLKIRATEDGRLKANEAASRWSKANPEKRSALSMLRHVSKLRRTPSWANLEKIAEFYSKALVLTQDTGVKHVVDHVIPLRGKLVSGLHVDTNLQILTFSENSRKSNKFVVP